MENKPSSPIEGNLLFISRIVEGLAPGSMSTRYLEPVVCDKDAISSASIPCGSNGISREPFNRS